MNTTSEDARTLLRAISIHGYATTMAHAFTLIPVGIAGMTPTMMVYAEVGQAAVEVKSSDA
jgi:hypothetical protein